MGKRGTGTTRTTAATRRSIQQSRESLRSVARHHGIDPKTAAKWRKRSSIDDRKTGPSVQKSSVLSIEEEAIVVAFRRYISLPLDECLRSLQAFIPRLTRSSLHRCLQRHGISRLPAAAQEAAASRSAGCFDVSVAEIPVGDHRYPVFIAVERSSRFVFAGLHDTATPRAAADFLRALIGAAPCAVGAVVTNGRGAFAARGDEGGTGRAPSFAEVCGAHHVEHDLSEGWSDGQQRSIERSIGAALGRRGGSEDSAQLRRRLAALLSSYNADCRLDALQGLAPAGYIAAHMTAPAAQRRRRAARARDRETAAPQDDMQESVASRRTAGRAKNPRGTREAILRAARSRLAHDGPEGLSLAEVARLAGVNRGTAYQHFETRDKLIAATADWVSEKLFRAVFGDPESASKRPVQAIDVAELTDRLSSFAMDNPELCRVWLLKVLSSPDPASDLFWREYQGSTARFAQTDLAQERVDAEVLSVIMLAGAFLWPVWARSKSAAGEDLRPLAYRFAQECLRISMYGNLRSERYPAIAKRLRARPGKGRERS